MPNTRVLLESDLIPPLVTELLCFSLSKVPLLQPGDGRENPARKDVPDEHIEAALKVLPPVIADILRIQLLTAMRPGEVCKMRVGDIKRSREDFAMLGRLDFSGDMWLYDLQEHKTARKIKGRIIILGLEAQEILRKYLSDDPAAPVFKNKRGREVSTDVLAKNIREVIAEHDLPKFVPYDIRHTAISRTSFAYDRDRARVMAGHTTEAMTARYDHSDLLKAFEIVREENREYRARRAVGSYIDETAPSLATGLRIFSGE